MYNPLHPGEFIQSVYLKPNNLSCRDVAAKLGVAASTLHRVLNGTSGISADMALRLSKSIGRSPESWLAMQDNYDLSQAKQTANLRDEVKVKPIAA
jgi:addiction module HigA family antidote